MRKLTLFSIAIFLAFGALSQKAGGWDGDRSQRPGGKHHKAAIEERLDLSDQQQEKIEALRLAHRTEMQKTKGQLDIKHAELKAEITGESVDQKKIDELVQEINELRGVQFANRTSHQLEVRALLDSKQRLLFDDMHAARGRHRENRF